MFSRLANTYLLCIHPFQDGLAVPPLRRPPCPDTGPEPWLPVTPLSSLSSPPWLDEGTHGARLTAWSTSGACAAPWLVMTLLLPRHFRPRFIDAIRLFD